MAAGQGVVQEAAAAAGSAVTVRGMRRSGGDHRGHGGVAFGPRLVEQVLAVQVEQVEQEGVRGRVAASRSTSSRLPTRLAVTWNGWGRPSGWRAMTSPSSTAVPTGRVRAAATTSGTRAVMSSRVRVNTATSVPSRWTWMRWPSSFHSTAASPTRSMAASMLGAVEASIGWRRPTSRRNWRSPGTPEARATSATGPRPPQHHRPPDLGPGHPGGPGDGLDHHALQGTLAQLAREQADQEPLLGRGRPAEQLGHLPPPLGLRPWSGEAADPLEGGVDLGHGQR